MYLLNHYGVGVVIVIQVGVNPAAAGIVFLSHYVLDALPHFGYEISDKTIKTRGRWLLRLSAVDVSLLLFAILSLHNSGLQTSYILLALVALMPDMAWVYRFIVQEKMGTKTPGPTMLLNSIHTKVQWYERQWALLLEIMFAFSVYYLIFERLI